MRCRVHATALFLALLDCGEAKKFYTQKRGPVDWRVRTGLPNLHLWQAPFASSVVAYSLAWQTKILLSLAPSQLRIVKTGR